MAGSWTKNMRPDYTLSLWPIGITQNEAENEEIIVHIHFDAKYKVEHLSEIFGELNVKEQTEEEIQEELSSEKEEQKRGTFKRVDLLKMHSYKDAIRRTAGSYILYPGYDEPYRPKGYHEIIPGLGAFSIRPSKANGGTEDLKNFLKEVVNHFLNRTSQREKTAYRVYDIHKDEPRKEDEIREPIPENQGTNRSFIPDETFVLVGYCKHPENINWYKKEGLYNFRMDDDKGSLVLENKVVNAKYLLLRESGKDTASRIFKIKSKGPKVIQGKILEKRGYLSDKIKDYYLVIDIENEESKDFESASFEFKKLDKYKSITENIKKTRIATGIPFAITLTELMKVKIK
jgi:hypothetical protein